MTEPTSRPRWRTPLLVALAVVVLVVVGAVLAVDQLALSAARREAATWSERLGRPIAIGGLRLKLLGGLGVRATDLSVGPAAGEDVPLVQVRRVEVTFDLVRALRSGGKELRVDEAVVEGLRLAVIRFSDGSTSVERLSSRLGPSEPAAPAPTPEAPADRSALRIGRAAVQDARIALVDRSVPGAKELAIDHLDVEVKDLAAGKPLLLTVRAAVLSEKPNFALDVKAAPLPPSLVPTPVEVTLRTEPIDLAPLGPFIPAAGLRAGSFKADLMAALGAAVPGGEGPTRVKGGLRATGLRFAGQEGGAPLDVLVDADLEGDATKGDLSITTLELGVGPAGLSGRGRATGLRGASPRLEGLSLVGHDLDPALLARYVPALGKKLGGLVAGPIGLTLRGSGTAEAQVLDLAVDLTPVRLDVPEELEKAAGAPMKLAARAEVAGAGERVKLDATLDLLGADLRPGGTLAKPPGQPLLVRFQGALRRSGGEERLEIGRLDLELLKDKLTGSGTVMLSGAAPKRSTKFALALAGDSLDLDAALIPTPKDEKPKKKIPAAYAGLAGTVDVKLGRVRMEGVDAKNVVARVKLVDDLLTVEEARLEAFGGKVSAGGTKLALARPEEPMTAVVQLTGVSAEQAGGLLSKRKVLSGALDGKLELQAGAWKGPRLLQTAAGSLKGTLRDGAFHGKDLVAGVAGPLAGRLPFVSPKLADGGQTSLGKELPFSVKIADGKALLEKPLEVKRPDATLSIQGGARLDGTLEMPVTMALAPDLVSKITGGKVKPAEPLPVGFTLTGPAWSPALGDLKLDAAVAAIARQAAAGALGKVLGAPAEGLTQKPADAAKAKLEEEAKKRLKGLFGR
ncbi:MAG TPA: AsmA family protein [Anaeromyxobacteraceae bacterium]|nr:AsmA family protein [Anaeromyxobacteraceae bacterium]